MQIGLPKEIKDQEFRVGLTPAAVHSLCKQGHQVVVENGAGVGSGFADQDYVQAGATLVSDPTIAWAQQMVIKVKEPQPSEYRFFRPGPDSVHLPAPGGGATADRSLDGKWGECDRLRNRDHC
jgi:alanine dehydrogenase